MRRSDANKLAEVHWQISDYVRWNLAEVIKLARPADIELLRKVEENVKPAKRPPKKGRKQAVQPWPYDPIRPASWFTYELECIVPSILEYVRAPGEEIVLSTHELNTLAQCADCAAPLGLPHKWQVWEAPHNTLSDCILTLTRALKSAAVDPLQAASENFAQLRQGKVSLHDGLQACSDVVDRITKMLKAAGWLEFIPAPEGIRLTPSTKAMTVPPKEIANIVRNIRLFLEKKPGARNWTANKLMAQDDSLLKGRRSATLNAIKFLRAHREMNPETDDGTQP